MTTLHIRCVASANVVTDFFIISLYCLFFSEAAYMTNKVVYTCAAWSVGRHCNYCLLPTLPFFSFLLLSLSLPFLLLRPFPLKRRHSPLDILHYSPEA